MSYILDALRRAEAERELGRVPGLHAPAVTPPGPLSGSRTPSLPTKLVVGGAAVLALALSLGVWLWPVPAVAPSDPAASVAAVGAMAPTSTSTSTPPAPPAVVTPAPGSAPTEAAATPVAVPKTAARNAPNPKQTQSTMPPSAAHHSAGLKPAAGAEPISQPVAMAPLLKDITEAVRSQIPALVISGAVYSENPAQRLLLVNGQVLTQGSQAAPDVTLEVIHPTTSEFSFRGTRFRMGH